MSPPSAKRIFACNSSSLRTANSVLFCACTSFYLLIFFNWLRIPNPYLHFLFLFLPNANLNPDFQEHIAFAPVSKPRTRVLARTTNGPQITTCTDWQLRGNRKLWRPKRPRRSYVAGVAPWHAPGGSFSNYVSHTGNAASRYTITAHTPFLLYPWRY